MALVLFGNEVADYLALGKAFPEANSGISDCTAVLNTESDPPPYVCTRPIFHLGMHAAGMGADQVAVIWTEVQYPVDPPQAND